MAFKKMESAGYLINHTARLFALGLREQIAPLGLAPAQFMTLLELWREDGLAQKDLVERLDVEQATMANTIARMERDGLVERRPNPEDGRTRSVFMTARARSLKDAATKAAQEVNQEYLSVLTPDERKQMIEMLQRIIVSRVGGKQKKAAVDV